MNQHLAKYGTYIGFISIAVYFLFYLFGIGTTASQYTTYVIIIIGLFLSLNHYRDNQLGGYMEYGKAVGTGALISVLFSVLIAIYQYIMFKMDPQILVDMMDQIAQDMYKEGLPEDEIEKMLGIMEQAMRPGLLGFSSFFGHAIMGVIFTLIISIFTKRKDPNPFSDVEGTLDS